MIDYHKYQFCLKELVKEILLAITICLFIGWLFFGSLIAGVFLSPAGIFLVRGRERKKAEQRLTLLRDEFKEFVVSFASSLQAGYTMDQAILVSGRDLKRSVLTEDSIILQELGWMEQQMELKVPCDILFADLAKRSGLEEIRSFSVVLTIGKRQGGNLVQITRKAAVHIAKKIQVQKEVEQSIAGRVMEKNIMACMPFFMLIYLRITNSAYIEVLFASMYGKGIMAVALLVFWFANKWADYIIKIRI